MHCSPTSVVKWDGLVEPPLGLVSVMCFMLIYVLVDHPRPMPLPALTLLPQSGAIFFISSQMTQVPQDHVHTNSINPTYLCHFVLQFCSLTCTCVSYVHNIVYLHVRTVAIIKYREMPNCPPYHAIFPYTMLSSYSEVCTRRVCDQ